MKYLAHAMKLGMLLSLSSCFWFVPFGLKIEGKKTKKKTPAPEIVAEPAQPYHSRPLPTTQNEIVKFKRQLQQTIRYNCDGHVTSNEIETLNHNTMYKKIKAKIENMNEAHRYEVYNRRNKSTRTGFKVGMGEFVVNIEHTTFHMKVNEGINLVEYVYYKCLIQNPDGSCAKEDLLKEGIVEVDVQYREEQLPGTREFKPSKEECKPTPIQ